MKEQTGDENHPFCVEKSTKYGPFFKLDNYRAATLEGKALFFEGQVDPLRNSNLTLKEQLTALSKIMAFSTELLRNLLPSMQDPAKKQRIHMSGLYEIASMIAEDWEVMEHHIQHLKARLVKVNEEWAAVEQDYRAQLKAKCTEITHLEETLSNTRSNLESVLSQLGGERKDRDEEKAQMQGEFDRKLSARQRECDRLARELQQVQLDTVRRCNQYEHAIGSLERKLSQGSIDFEDGKVQYKKMFERLMEEKLQEQAANYEQMVKNKEEENFAMQLRMSDIDEKEARFDNGIRRMNEQQIEDRRQIGKLKGELHDQKVRTQSAEERYRGKDHELHLATQRNDKLSQTVKEQQTYFEQAQAAEQRLKQTHEEEKERIRAEGREEAERVWGEVRAGEARLQRKQEEMGQILKSLSGKDGEWGRKIGDMQAEFESQRAQLRDDMEMVKMAAERERENHLRERKSKELDAEIKRKQNEETIRVLNLKFLKEKGELAFAHQVQLGKLREEMEEERLRVKREWIDSYSQLNKEHQAALKAVREECQARMASNDVDAAKGKDELRTAMRRQELELVEKKQELARFAKLLREKEDQLEETQVKQRNIMARMDERHQKEQQMLQSTLEGQMGDFQNQLEKREVLILNVKQEMQQELEQLKKDKGMDVVEARCQRQITHLVKDYEAKIVTLREETRREQERREEEHRAQLEQLVELNFEKEVRLRQNYQGILIRITRWLENEEIATHQRAMGAVNSNLEEVEEEDKIDYIRFLSKLLKAQVKSREETIAGLEGTIGEKEHQIQEMKEHVQELVQERKDELAREREVFIEDWTNKIDKTVRETESSMRQNEQECKVKVETAERDRRNFSEQLREEFQEMKGTYYQKYRLLEDKYNELERLFDQRPSRSEDVLKIRELTNLKSKMDQEMKTYYKKVEKANEIVKYLNMELENYKVVYDIFGKIESSPTKSIPLESPFVEPAKPPTQPLKPPPKLEQLKTEPAKAQAEAGRAKVGTPQRRSEHSSERLKNTLNEMEGSSILLEPKGRERSRNSDRERDRSRSRSRKYSYLSIERRPSVPKDRQQTDKQPELISHAEHFIRLLRKEAEQGQPIEGDEQMAPKKNIRKRRIVRKTTALDGAEVGE